MERYSLLKATLVGVALYEVSKFAFSRASRQEILERDGNKCLACGATDHLEAAHINHNKFKKTYDDPENGLTLCVKDHLKDHILRHGKNGLSREKNLEAIKSLEARSGIIYQE